MEKFSEQSLETLRRATLTAWPDVQRGGAKLLFVAPIFVLPLCIAAFFMLPGPPILPAMLLLGLLAGMAYLWRGLRKLHAEPAALIHAVLTEKRVHQTTDPNTRRVSRWYSFLLKVEHGEGINRDGSMAFRPGWLAGEAKLAVTEEIYEHCVEGDRIVAVALPHDRAIYKVLDALGDLFPPAAAI